MIIIGKTKEKNKAINIRSFQANSVYLMNEYDAKSSEEKGYEEKKPYLDMGKAVLNNSLFTEYMVHHGMVVTRRGNSKDFIVMKFDYGVKDGMSSQDLRDYYYEHGVTINLPTYNRDGVITKEETVKYKMLMRNPGKAKDGECIFVKEELHNVALKYITMDLWEKMPMDNADIVGMSAYAPLTTATAIDYITIPMENIFIVKDEDVSTMIKAFTVKTREIPYVKQEIDYKETEEYINIFGFTFYKRKQKENPKLKYIASKSKTALKSNGINPDDCPMQETIVYKKECYVDRTNEETEVKNTLWDGMGLADESIFPEEMDGFIYCRTHFFKSCLFRGNIQDYFKNHYRENYDTATVTDMFGNVFRVKDIKVIITENSIKWIKFKNLMGKDDKAAYKYYVRVMKKHNEKFAIVKTAHKSKWGELQRSSYQINNSLPTTNKQILKPIAKPSINYCNALKTDHEAFINHLKINTNRYSINNVLVALDEWNEDFKCTEYFKTKKDKIISDFKNKRLKLGKLLQYGDNLTICGNPIALLMKVTGQNFLNEGCFENIQDAIQCYTTRFEDNEKLAGFRSPHNSPNNIVHLVNNRSKLIEKYFPKLGDNVIIINGIYTDVQSRLNGQDLDTDAVYVTNQSEIVKLAKCSYENYPTIINGIPLAGDSIYKKDMKSYAKMDNKISAAQYAIGYASNVAQLALSYYYDGGCESTDLEDVFIICSVLAQVAIDSAKRTHDIDFNSELRRLGRLSCMNPNDGKKYPIFYAENQKENKKNTKSNIKEEEVKRFNCPMEILAEIIEEGIIDLRKHKEFEVETKPLSVVFQHNKESGSKKYKQFKKIISIVHEYDKKVKELDKADDAYSKKVNGEFDECMRKIDKLSVNKTTMSALIDYAFNGKGGIRSRLLVALYEKDTEKFLNCFKKLTKEDNENAESLDFRAV